jgi:hypothetical protein
VAVGVAVGVGVWAGVAVRVGVGVPVGDGADSGGSTGFSIHAVRTITARTAIAAMTQRIVRRRGADSGLGDVAVEL